jgi:hypothetical protein
MQQTVAIVGVAIALTVIVAPALLGVTGSLRGRRASSAVPAGRTQWNWRLMINSALLYALAFNLVFFIQELFLVLPKALTPGLSPTLFHNNHRWDGEHPLANLFQGAGALTILLTGLAFLFWLARRPGRSVSGRLFCIWMAYHGCFESLPQVVIGAINPQNDVGMAMDYFSFSPAAKTTAALAALVAIAAIAIRLTPHLLALATAPGQIDGPSKRTRFIFQVATLPALIGILLVVPFRVPGHVIEVLILPIIVALVGIGWIQAGAWRATDVRWSELRPVRSIRSALAVLIGMLLIFQIVLRPGIPF